MENKFKADNGIANLYWGLLALGLLTLIVYRFLEGSTIWPYILYFAFAVLFILTTTIKEYVITELNFIETKFYLMLFSKNKRIAVGDIVGLKKLKSNQLRIDLVRGFEILRVNKSDIDAFIEELIDRNPRIKMPK